MPKIPVYEQQVSIGTPTVSKAPSPGVVKDAFGGSVFEANQSIAKAGAQAGDMLFKHAQERQLQIDNAEVAQRETNAASDLQSILFSNEIKKVNVNGSEYDASKLTELLLNSTVNIRRLSKSIYQDLGLLHRQAHYRKLLILDIFQTNNQSSSTRVTNSENPWLINTRIAPSSKFPLEQQYSIVKL
jgi:hypothetical protein